MSIIQRGIRAAINQAGFDIIRIPKPQPTAQDNGLEYYKTAIGNYYVPGRVPGDVIAQRMRRGQVFEPEVVDLARRFIKPGTAVVDVGANFGQMALMFGGMVGTDGIVYALEAQRRVYDILDKNVDANNATNVKPIFRAAYRKTGERFHFPRPDFVRFGTYGSYNLPLDAEEGDPVDSIQIDDLGIEKPVSFMKVDVQGCDLFAMQGAVRMIERNRMPIVFEFEQRFQQEYGTCFQDYVEFVSAIGYRFTETVLDINYLVQCKHS